MATLASVKEIKKIQRAHDDWQFAFALHFIFTVSNLAQAIQKMKESSQWFHNKHVH